LIANGSVIPPLTPDNPGDLPVQLRFYGDPDSNSEIVIAYEAGWRRQWHRHLSTDLALFWNDYDQLFSAALAAPFPESQPVPHLVLPFNVGNAWSGHTYGLEIAADWRPLNDWRLQASYSYLQMNLNDPTGFNEGGSPRHQLSLLSSLTISPQIELNLWLRYVDELPSLQIPAYATLDARLAWSPDPDLTFSLVGQNLLDDRYPEYFSADLGPAPGEIERGVYLKALWRF
jgi:iron complex outermembrane receptor protein